MEMVNLDANCANNKIQEYLSKILYLETQEDYIMIIDVHVVKVFMMMEKMENA